MIADATMIREIDSYRTIVRHMYKHAGWSHDPGAGETSEQGRFRCAAGLANARIEASDRGWVFKWTDDGMPYDLGDTNEDGTPYTPEEVLECVLEDADGRVLGSRGGIADPTPEYGRVVEAELAAEALAELRDMPRAAREKAGRIASDCGTVFLRLEDLAQHYDVTLRGLIEAQS